MHLRGHYQNAYVTHDLEAAMKLIDDRFGKLDWIMFEPDMILKTPHGDKAMANRVGLAWAGGLNLEIIQPVSGYIEDYAPFLPADRSDPTPRFHHTAVRRENEAEMRAEIEKLGLPLAFEGEVPGLLFIYLDARASLGHYFEYVCATPEMWTATGWPEGRPVL